MEQWHELYRAENLLEAALLQGMLGNIGIESHIDGQYCAAAAGELPMEVIQVSLKVNLFAWERAKLALKDYQRGRLAYCGSYIKEIRNLKREELSTEDVANQYFMVGYNVAFLTDDDAWGGVEDLGQFCVWFLE